MAVEPDPRVARRAVDQGQRCRPPSQPRLARMTDIAVVDYGMGNLRSVAKALEHVAPRRRGRASRATRTSSRRAERVVFPGQGAMPDCMRELDARGPARRGRSRPRATKPFLGICIGLQMLFERSEEGDTPGLGAACRAGCGASRPRMVDAPGGEAQGAAHGLERGAPEPARTRCGRASPTATASISCTATSAEPARAASSSPATRRYPVAVYLRRRAR